MSSGWDSELRVAHGCGAKAPCRSAPITTVKFPASFVEVLTGVPVHIKHIFTGVPKFSHNTKPLLT